MPDDNDPIAYTALQKGVPMRTKSGRQFGLVEHVLQIPEEDLFDGIVVDTPTGLRFVDRDLVDDITTAQVRCSITDEQAATLPEPDGSPVFHADALKDDGKSLQDRFGQMFGRARWKRG